MHERKKTDIEFLAASNRTLQKFTGEVEPLQESLVLHTMKSFIPNVLNDVLDFFFADHIVLFLFSIRTLKVVEVIQTFPLNSSMRIRLATSVGSILVPSLAIVVRM